MSSLSLLIKFALHSKLSEENELEFKRMAQELENLEYKTKPNGTVVLAMKDSNVGKTRALCFLQGLYALNL